jgi:NAD(P)-dependent dehydrogenase (short-subunit alcohol dehydrogenase family)
MANIVDLAGKSVLVTGATSGIGAAIARTAAAAGARVMLTGRSAERGEAVRRDCGADARFMSADVTQKGVAERLVDETVKQFGRIDVLVNNAGVEARGTVETVSDEDWHRILAVNVTGVFYMARAAVRAMKRQGGGVIVNMGSDWSVVGGRQAFAYCASKGAVAQMTRAMALDHAREGIRVNCLCPGDTETPMLVSGLQIRTGDVVHGLKLLGEGLPLGRVGRPEEIAKAAVFLASDASSFMTGALMLVDGGNTAG